MPAGMPYSQSGAPNSVEGGFRKSLAALRSQNAQAPQILEDARRRRMMAEQGQFDRSRENFNALGNQRYADIAARNAEQYGMMGNNYQGHPSGMGLAPGSQSASGRPLNIGVTSGILGRREELGLEAQQAASQQRLDGQLSHLTGGSQDPSMPGSVFGKYAPAEGMVDPLSRIDRAHLIANMRNGSTTPQDVTLNRSQNLAEGHVPEGRQVPGSLGTRVMGINEAGAPILSGQDYYAKKFGGPPGSPQYEAGMKGYADAAIARQSARRAMRKEMKENKLAGRTAFYKQNEPKGPGIMDGVAPAAPAVGATATARVQHSGNASKLAAHPSVQAAGIPSEGYKDWTQAAMGAAIASAEDEGKLGEADYAHISQWLGEYRASMTDKEWNAKLGTNLEGRLVVDSLLKNKKDFKKSIAAARAEARRQREEARTPYGAGTGGDGYWSGAAGTGGF